MIREPYSPSYAKLKPNTPRRATPGRFSNGQNNNTFYHKHPGGALPRDVIKIPALAGGAGKREGVNHPAQKPKLLTEKLILSALNPATKTNLVVVPFAGSGTECLISKKLNCDYIGFEVNAEYIKLSQSRINQLLLQKQPQLI